MANSTTVLLPVYRGAIRAVVDRGQRWTDIEHLVLFALTIKNYTIGELVIDTCLPSQILIESIHRLMKAGWVDVTETEHRIAFQATLSGAAEATRSTLTPIPREQTRNLHFAVDRVSNQVFPFRDLKLMNEKSARNLITTNKGSPPIVLEPNIFDHDLPAYDDIVKPLLSREEEFVSYRADKSWLSDNFYARFIVTESEIEGLPDYANDPLPSIIVENVRRELSDKSSHKSTLRNDEIKTATWPTHDIKFDKKDLCIGGEAHKILFTNLLKNARQRILIHSTFIRHEALEAQIDAFNTAANKGVEIDILWDCQNNNSAGKKLRLCRKLINAHGLNQNFRIHPTATNSHAKMIVADDGQGEYLAIVGSCNWLNTNFNSMEVSVCFKDRQMVYNCLGIFARLIHHPRFRDIQLRADIIELRNHLTPTEETTPFTANVRLLSLGCHEECIDMARDTAERDIFIASNKLGGPAETQLLIPLASAVQTRDTKVSVYFQQQSGPAAEDNVRTALKGKYADCIALQQVKSAHAKLLCWDDDHLVITSLNWLSKDIDSNKSLSEIGVYIQSPGITNYVKSQYLANC